MDNSSRGPVGRPRPGAPPGPPVRPAGDGSPRTGPARGRSAHTGEVALMSAVTMSAPSLTRAHRQFEAALPRMENVFGSQFRRWPEPRRAEAIAEARAATWAAWHGLVSRGQDPT